MIVANELKMIGECSLVVCAYVCVGDGAWFESQSEFQTNHKCNDDVTNFCRQHCLVRKCMKECHRQTTNKAAERLFSEIKFTLYNK